MTVKFDMSKYRILAIAVAASVAWHLFWLFAIKIDISPRQTKEVKFSKVSFLGPILDIGAVELRVEPPQRSFLEKRYMGRVARIPYGVQESAKDVHPRYDPNASSGIIEERDIPLLINEALDARKSEPAYGTDY
jgi:hypothetical protein